MWNYVAPGDTIPVFCPRDVRSGDGVVVGGIAGVATHDCPAGAVLEVQIEGLLDLIKENPAELFAVGAGVAMDATTGLATQTPTGTQLVVWCGLVVAPTGAPSEAGEATVRTKMTPRPPAPPAALAAAA
jgi:predicted RecA/RadA family phage recombinase